MAAVWRHFKRNWKIYGIFFGTWLGSRWGAKRYREAAITRSYCVEAKQYSEKTVSLMDKIDRIYLFLNPKSNNSNAKKLFMKYSAPIFNLSGTEIVLIESDYEGQIQSLISYIQSSGTAALVVAGGSGTLLEVVNGLLRRNGLSVPVGVLPLGKDNSFYYSQLREKKGKNELPARSIGEATMNIIRGSTKPVNIIKLKPEKGKTLYAVSSVKWGVVHDAEINRNSWRLFGLFRTFLSYTSTAVRKWPMGFTLNITERERGETQAAVSPPVAPLRRSVDIVGFNIEEERELREGSLVLSWLPSELTKKSDFIKQGFYRSFSKKKATNLGDGLTSESISSNDFNIRPSTNISTTSKTDSSTGDAGLVPQYWYSVDGEPFEAVPLDVSLERDRLQVFCTS